MDNLASAHVQAKLEQNQKKLELKEKEDLLKAETKKKETLVEEMKALDRVTEATTPGSPQLKGLFHLSNI